MKRSVHHKTLRRLGFVKQAGQSTKDHTITEALIGRRLTAAEKRRCDEEASKPSFTLQRDMEGDFTEANDETGQLWLALGHIDLTDLGFENTVNWLLTMATASETRH